MKTAMQELIEALDIEMKQKELYLIGICTLKKKKSRCKKNIK